MKELFTLEGKNAIVIGGAGGIGAAIAEAFAFYGADVSIASRKMENLLQTKDNIKKSTGKDVSVYTVDASKEESIIALVDTVLADKDHIDILVNSQGYNVKYHITELPVEIMEGMMNVNVIGIAMLCKHFGKHMKDRGYGRIINVSSTRGSRACLGGNASYCTTKGALDMLTRTLACDLGPEVTVNAIGPTNTVTPMMEGLIKEHPEILHLGDDKPLQRIGRVEDCMGPAVFLASEAAGFVTGQILYVDGGMTAIG
ncbi:Gluconate 5-dehydrogenase [uncultured Roseburia sp.]|uniref:SDR family oxidoreductase n=1 Tax=Brotonthovivens ammoniilytica TaxID=2981725 RepID=A0ABT2TG22_9FIRM|nr:SDR family oxidoreductase [Brotonthovivens ammoniilytica]MCU6761091.1 SDR family oxidoreductase [Brotonthovivens ammoniilytica]SCI18565.1 Gluconate 5-dehydrogenase [uncultured Roseburia sp.]